MGQTGFTARFRRVLRGVPELVVDSDVAEWDALALSALARLAQLVLTIAALG
jgi:hypothetical protein